MTDTSIADSLASAAEAVSHDAPTLQEVVATSKRLVELDSEVAGLEKQLEEAKAAKHQLATQTLPNMIQAAGLSSVPLDNGLLIKISPIYSCSIKKDATAEALAWLRNSGAGDIIKNELKIRFKAGQDKVASKWLERAQEKGVDYESKQNVHPQTLNKFLKETTEAGDKLPDNLFNSFVGSVAKVVKNG